MVLAEAFNENKMRKVFLFFILILLVLASGCVDVKQPTASGSATIKHIKIDYAMDILLTNPNNFEFTVDDISITLQRTDGEIIGGGILSGGSISAQTSKHFYGTLSLSDSILTAQNDEKIYLIIETTAKGGVWFMQKEEKIYKKVEMTNPIKGKTEISINM